MKEIVKNIIKKHGWYIVGLATSLTFFDVIIKREFAHTDSSKIYYVAKSPEEAIEYIKTYSPQEIGLKFARA